MSTLPILPSTGRQILNGITCIVTFYFIFTYVQHNIHTLPITIDSIWQISLAEINRRKNIARVQLLESDEDEPNNLEETTAKKSVRHIASVVGYREEPGLYRRCLESYRGTPGLEIMLVGIDGNHDGDMEMIRITEEVFSERIIRIHIEEPFGPLAVRHAKEYVERSMSEKKEIDKIYEEDEISKELIHDAHRHAFRFVLAKAVEILRENKVLYSNDSGVMQTICLYQPHLCKKDIMFTNLVFSLALGQANGIEFLWTSDSDTWVYPDTLYLTIGCMSADPLIGGTCSALSIHNGSDSFIAQLGAAAYWTELAITRGQTGAVDSADCQPGPCAAFRFTALQPILMAWYTQTSIGVKTVVNEDRHLTTNLLLTGWKVTFNTQTLASTDSPTTLLRWLLQQLRWARATHIETFQYPQVYCITSPILFLIAMRRFYCPLIVGILTIRYVFTGHVHHVYSFYDLGGRILISTVYNFLVNKRNVNGIGYLVLSQFFYQLPLPGIMFWSVVTFLERGWGTSMRNLQEAQKAKRAGLENLWNTSAVVVWMGFVGAAFARYVAYRLAPEWTVQLMLVSAGGTVGGLFFALLG